MSKFLDFNENTFKDIVSRVLRRTAFRSVYHLTTLERAMIYSDIDASRKSENITIVTEANGRKLRHPVILIPSLMLEQLVITSDNVERTLEKYLKNVFGRNIVLAKINNKYL